MMTWDREIDTYCDCDICSANNDRRAAYREEIGDMYRLRLKSGMHIQADKTKPLSGPDGKPTGRFESVTFKKGGTFDSEKNLAATEPERYELVGGESSGDAARIAELEAEVAKLRATVSATTDISVTNPSVAPGGQVSSGFQQASGSKTGTTSGPMDAATAATHGASGLESVSQAGPVSLAAPTVKPFVAASQPSSHIPSDAVLEGMSVAELREVAEAEEVDLHGAPHKADMVKKLKAARK